jgi:hypothetical protein
MSQVKTYTVTFSERIHARTEVKAASVQEAEDKAARKFHDDCFRALEQMDTPSEILDFDGPDCFECEEDCPLTIAAKAAISKAEP